MNIRKIVDFFETMNIKVDQLSPTLYSFQKEKYFIHLDFQKDRVIFNLRNKSGKSLVNLTKVLSKLESIKKYGWKIDTDNELINSSEKEENVIGFSEVVLRVLGDGKSDAKAVAQNIENEYSIKE